MTNYSANSFEKYIIFAVFWQLSVITPLANNIKKKIEIVLPCGSQYSGALTINFVDAE